MRGMRHDGICRTPRHFRSAGGDRCRKKDRSAATVSISTRFAHEARKNGMVTMFEDGLRKVELAETTIDEVLRVIRE